MTRAALGAAGEREAARFLSRLGWTIIRRNWRLAGGEIDLLARDPDGTIVVVEVRTRRGERGATALESIGARKRATLQRLALAVSARYPEANIRVDAIALQSEDSIHLDYYDDILN